MVRRAAGALLVLLVVAVVGPTAITPAGAAASDSSGWRHDVTAVSARPAPATSLARLGTRSGGPQRHLLGQSLATARTVDLRFATVGSSLPPGTASELARRTTLRLPVRGPPTATSH